MDSIYRLLKFIVDDNRVDGLVDYDSDVTLQLPQRLNRSLKKVNPRSLLIVNNKPTILFFDKNVDRKKVFKQCWNFSEAPIIIIENNTDFDIYNGFDYIAKDGEFLLKEIEDRSEINYISIISGEYFAKSKDFSANNINKVDKKLLENIKYAREKLLNLNLSNHIANSLLGRVIFIRYLIDREVLLKFEGKHKALTNDELKDILTSEKRTYKLFRYLKSDDGFNGDWFPIEESEENIVNETHLEVLRRLISETDLKTNQGSLFEIYDFSIIPIEFISNVYESFIGEENQKKDGAYYTPTFLVDYILKYTVDKYFEDNPNEYNCRVLDPACGSGIFLVETLRKLIAQYEKAKKLKIKKREINAEEIVQLVKDNIFGIDKNKNALQISVFSLYLTMLDYQSPTDIAKFTFPYLLDSVKNKDKPNFFHSDFFNTEVDFNTILKEKELDFIIGNPPYGRSTIEEGTFVDEYIKTNKIEVGNRDIVQPFMVRVKDLVAKNTTISFIVTSKVLYNLQSKNFRVNHFFNNFKINHILELSSVRKEIFESADIPVSIIFYQYCENKKEILENKINYISMKPSPYFEKLKTLFISKSDFKKVQQSKVLEYDYLWKILVYGSYLDFNFIKRLKEYDSVNQIAKNKNYVKGMGIQATKGKYNVENYIGMSMIDVPRGKQSDKYMNSFYISNKLPKWTIRNVHRVGKKELFKKYSVLVRRGVSTETFRAKSAVLYDKAVFKHTLTGVNTPLKDEAKNFMGIINSILFVYYNIECATSFGIEREQLHDKEKLESPYIYNKEIIFKVSQIENLKKDFFDKNCEDLLSFEKKEKKLISELDNIVLRCFSLNKQEYSLVDYASNIIIPWIRDSKRTFDTAFKKLKYKDKIIESYIDIFTEHYTKIYAQINKYFLVKVYWDKYAIGIYFKVSNRKPKEQIEWVKEPTIQNFLKISSGKTLENLFIQKDIKGFEADGFYVIKPNEYKNWHEAIGYLDFYEFEKAILGAGRRGNNA